MIADRRADLEGEPIHHWVWGRRDGTTRDVTCSVSSNRGRKVRHMKLGRDATCSQKMKLHALAFPTTRTNAASIAGAGLMLDAYQPFSASECAAQSITPTARRR